MTKEYVCLAAFLRHHKTDARGGLCGIGRAWLTRACGRMIRCVRSTLHLTRYEHEALYFGLERVLVSGMRCSVWRRELKGISVLE